MKCCTCCFECPSEDKFSCKCGFVNYFYQGMRDTMIKAFDQDTLKAVEDQIFDAWNDFSTNKDRAEYIDALYSAKRNGVVLVSECMPKSNFIKYGYKVYKDSSYVIVSTLSLDYLNDIIKLYDFKINE